MIGLLAPAKLTRSLRITGVRPDGLHELEAEMVSLNLADELLVEPGGEGLDVGWAGGWAPPMDAGLAGDPAPMLDGGPANLVTRALAVTGRRARVRLTKRIPIGGGLGGGSSDAAAILRWAGCHDLGVAASLGADVPFCLVGGRARVSGIGDEVDPLPFERRSFLLLLPPFGVSTAAVYAAWDAGDRRGSGREQVPGENDLTGPAMTIEPRLVRWRDHLGELSGREPVLAGSGSTWFVEVDDLPEGAEPESVTVDGERGTLVRTVSAPPQGRVRDGAAGSAPG